MTVQFELTSLIVCEVLQGVRNESQFCGFMRDLLQLPVFGAISTRLAIASAQNHRTLRNRGINVRKAVDCVIATFCIEQSYQLLHRDRDFDAFEDHLGLRALHSPAIPLN